MAFKSSSALNYINCKKDVASHYRPYRTDESIFNHIANLQSLVGFNPHVAARMINATIGIMWLFYILQFSTVVLR